SCTGVVVETFAIEHGNEVSCAVISRNAIQCPYRGIGRIEPDYTPSGRKHQVTGEHTDGSHDVKAERPVNQQRPAARRRDPRPVQLGSHGRAPAAPGPELVRYHHFGRPAELYVGAEGVPRGSLGVKAKQTIRVSHRIQGLVHRVDEKTTARREVWIGVTDSS